MKLILKLILIIVIIIGTYIYVFKERPTIMCQDKIEKKFKHKLGTQKAEKWSLKIFLSKIKFFALQAALLSFT